MGADAQSGPAVVCEGVSLYAGEARLVRDVSLRVPPGTIHCLVGPNGAGKTSLLRCLLGQAEHEGSV
ncbi:MAG TPA: ATP-binding cassette domain-containing protein, partial [Opitutaceae bacterium]